MADQPRCIDCGQPAEPRPGKPDRCAECVAIAQDIAAQMAGQMIASLRQVAAADTTEDAA